MPLSGYYDRFKIKLGIPTPTSDTLEEQNKSSRLSVNLTDLQKVNTSHRNVNTEIIISDRDKKDFESYFVSYEKLNQLPDDKFKEEVSVYLNNYWSKRLKIFSADLTEDGKYYNLRCVSLIALLNITALIEQTDLKHKRILIELLRERSITKDLEHIKGQSKRFNQLVKNTKSLIKSKGYLQDCNHHIDFLSPYFNTNAVSEGEMIEYMNHLANIINLIDEYVLGSGEGKEGLGQLAVEWRVFSRDCFEFYFHSQIDQRIDALALELEKQPVELPAAVEPVVVMNTHKPKKIVSKSRHSHSTAMIMEVIPDETLNPADLGIIAEIDKNPLTIGRFDQTVAIKTGEFDTNNNNNHAYIGIGKKSSEHRKISNHTVRDLPILIGGHRDKRYRINNTTHRKLSKNFNQAPNVTLDDVITPNPYTVNQVAQQSYGYSATIDLEQAMQAELNAKQRLIEIQNYIFNTKWSTGLGGLWVTLNDDNGKEICNNTVPHHMKRMLDEINKYQEFIKNKDNRNQIEITARSVLNKIKTLADGEHAESNHAKYKVKDSFFLSQLFYGNRTETIKAYQILKNIVVDVSLQSQIAAFRL